MSKRFYRQKNFLISRKEILKFLIIKEKNEFTIEISKEGGNADFVIFINGEDIVIPVEVERHGNIKAGREQLLRYQKDWDKKYGILTESHMDCMDLIVLALKN